MSAGLTPGRQRTKRLRLIGLALLALVAVALPFFLSEFRVSQFTLVLVYAAAILGLNLLVGYSGQISLGHGAFFALGAYTAAICITDLGIPHLVAIIPAGLIAGVAGLLFGIPALRLHGVYLALVTLALAVATPPVIRRFDQLTGGSQGLTIDQPEVPGWLGLAQDQFLYLLTLVVAVVVFVLVANMLRSRVGRALVSIRDAEIAATSVGVDIARYKTGAFAVSSACAGVAGALYVFAVGFVSPESFTLVLSIQFLAAVVVGGLATVGGAVLGALFIVFVPEYASQVNDALAGVIYGAVIILFMLFFPRGAMGFLNRVGRRFTGGPGGGEQEAVETEAAAPPPAAGRENTGGVPATGR